MSDFLSQGGYAFYVWTAYGVCALLLVSELVVLRKQRKELLSRIRRLMRMNKNEENV